MSANFKNRAALAAIIFGASFWHSTRNSFGYDITANASAESCSQYTVIKGDTIGAILDRLNLHRIWGDHGTALEMVRLNPGKIEYNGDLITPGIILKLPKVVSCSVLAQAEIGRYPASEPTSAPIPSPISQPAPQPVQAAPIQVAPVQVSPIQVAPPVAVAPVQTLPPIQVVSVEVAPAPVVKPSPPVPESEQEFAGLSFAPQFLFLRLTALDPTTREQAVLSSNLSNGINLSWGQKWSPEFQTKLYFAIQSLQFTSAVSNTSIANPGITTHEFGFKSEYLAAPALAFSTSAGVSQNLLVQGINSTSFRFVEYMDPSIGAGITLYPLRGKSIRLGLGVDGALYFPTSSSGYSVQLGESLEGKLSVVQDLSKTFELQGALSYQGLSQNNSLTQESIVQLLFEIGITFRVRTY